MEMPTSPDEELIERLRKREITPSMYGGFDLMNPDGPDAADRIESLLADRAKLEGENAELRNERDALLQKPIDLAKLDSIDEDASGKMVAYYWWQQAQDARAALNRSTDRAT